MNAAGGGTNIPTLMGGKPGYAGGGEVTSYQQLIEEGGTVDDSGNMGGMRSIDVVFPIEKSGFFGRKRTRRTNRFLFDGGQEVTMPIEDLINIKLFDSGSQAESVTSKRSDGTGFIKGMGNLMSGKTFSGEDRVKPQRSRGQGNKIKAVRRKSMETNIEPSEKKKNVIRAYEQEKNKMSDSPNVEKSNSEIPQFDVTLGRSAPKIKVLGISV
tara:strand:- start:9949 stop:10584 length:636 start_codon:yes stop_codon:yes gene_type:complete